MKPFRKKIYAAAGFQTVFMGPGRKEFDPSKPMKTFETYLKETAEGTCAQVSDSHFDEGVIGSFMAARFLNQGNLPGFLPFMVEHLKGKPCTAVEGACGTGGRAISVAIRSILSDIADSVFVAGFEVQNVVKSVYGADILAGADYYKGERKKGHALFFPGVFAERAGAYFQKYGKDISRRAMAKWYECAILNARKNPKAQEFENGSTNLFELGMTPPNPDTFLPYINPYDCSKVSDGASSILILSEEGLRRHGIDKRLAVEIIGIGESEDDITKAPQEMTALTTTLIAAKKALDHARLRKEEIAVLELHDCFTISGLLALEAIGYAPAGKAPDFVLDGGISMDGLIPVNPSGGLCGLGHPTGATGVRQLVDLQKQLTGLADNPVRLKSPFGMMVSMGGNDKTVTSLIVKRCEA